MKYLFHLGLSIVFLVAFLSLTGDKPIIIRLEFKVFDEKTEKGLSGARVEVFTEDDLFLEAESDFQGVVPKFEIPSHKIYQIVIGKTGYVSKMIEIDARTEGIADPLPLSIHPVHPTLFKAEPGVDLSFLETTPMVKYAYNKNGVLEFDKKYTEEMTRKVNSIRQGN